MALPFVLHCAICASLCDALKRVVLMPTVCPLCARFQPSPRDHLEAGERGSLPQQSENEELQCGAGDPQLPAGGRRWVRVPGRKQDGEERGERTTPVPWYGLCMNSVHS